MRERGTQIDTARGPWVTHHRMREMCWALADAGEHRREKTLRRMAACMTAVGDDVALVETAHGGVGTRGMRLCCNKELCPICGLAHEREWADTLRAQGGAPVMWTLTLRHSHGDKLADLLRVLKAAFGRWQRRLGRGAAVSWYRRLEVTWSYAAGWHPHYHVLVWAPQMRETEWAAEHLSRWQAAWVRAVEASGGSALPEVGCTLTVGAASAYTECSWEWAEETSLASLKGAVAGSLTVRDLIERGAAHLYLELIDATHGIRWRQTSMLFRDEAAEKESAEEPEIPAEKHIMTMHRSVWNAFLPLGVHRIIRKDAFDVLCEVLPEFASNLISLDRENIWPQYVDTSQLRDAILERLAMAVAIREEAYERDQPQPTTHLDR